MHEWDSAVCAEEGDGQLAPAALLSSSTAAMSCERERVVEQSGSEQYLCMCAVRQCCGQLTLTVSSGSSTLSLLVSSAAAAAVLVAGALSAVVVVVAALSSAMAAR